MVNRVSAVEIHNFGPEALEAQREIGWAVVRDAVDQRVVADLKRPLYPLLWKDKLQNNERLGFKRYAVKYHNQPHMRLRQGPFGLPNGVLEGLRLAVQYNALRLGDTDLQTWGNETWGAQDRAKKLARKVLPNLVKVTEEDRLKTQYSGGFHIVEAGGQIVAHCDGPGVVKLNAVLVVDHDPNVDAGLEFNPNPADPNQAWVSTSARSGDLVLINEDLQPWHRYAYPAEASRPRMTFLAVYDRMDQHI